MSGLKLFWMLVCLLLASVHARKRENMICDKGKKYKKVTLNIGETLSFKTAGSVYAPKQKCTAVYKLGDCTEAKVTCPKFATVGFKNCKRGDSLTVRVGKKSTRFCDSKGPDMTIKDSFSLQFKSDKRKTAAGLDCKIECTAPLPTTTTPKYSPTPVTGATAPPTPPTNGTTQSGEDYCRCGLARRSNKIVGGEETEINEYPWQVGLVRKNSKFSYCGGSIIGDRWILTAAHCLIGKTTKTIEVILGDHNQAFVSETQSKRVQIRRIIKHWKYDKRTLNYDFALLQLKYKINFEQNPHMRPVCLPEIGTTNDYAGYDAIVTGWGTLNAGGSTTSKLREVTVQVMTNEKCKKAYGSQIKSQMLCAAVDGGGKDSCQGDSGGPLVTSGNGTGVDPGQNYDLIGIVSWGYGCASAKYPGVYARVTEQLQWIYDKGDKFGQPIVSCPRI